MTANYSNSPDYQRPPYLSAMGETPYTLPARTPAHAQTQAPRRHSPRNSSLGPGPPALKIGPQLDLIGKVAAGLRQRTLIRGGSRLVRHSLAQNTSRRDQIGLR